MNIKGFSKHCDNCIHCVTCKYLESARVLQKMGSGSLSIDSCEFKQEKSENSILSNKALQSIREMFSEKVDNVKEVKSVDWEDVVKHADNSGDEGEILREINKSIVHFISYNGYAPLAVSISESALIKLMRVVKSFVVQGDVNDIKGMTICSPFGNVQVVVNLGGVNDINKVDIMPLDKSYYKLFKKGEEDNEKQ